MCEAVFRYDRHLIKVRKDNVFMKFVKNIVKAMTPWMEREKKIYRLYKKSAKWIARNNTYLAYYYCYKIEKKYGCIISPRAKVGQNLRLPHPMGVIIGVGVEIGDNVTIYQNTTLGRKHENVETCPKVGNNVTIYCNSTVVGDVMIGDNATIGCNSVVLRSVAENEVCSGIVK